MTEQKTKRRGCLFYGCITGALLLVLLLVAFLVSLRYAKKVFDDFADTKPMPLAQAQISQAELDALQTRVDAYRSAVKRGEAAGPLALTSNELNALIASDPDLKPLKGKAYLTLEGDQIKAQISVPMEQVGLPIKGRYFNGNGTLRLSFQDGIARLHAESLSSKGKPVPEQFMQIIRQHNFIEDVNHDPRGQAALSKLQEIKVEDSKLVVVPKSE